jgi:hypothetical protein
MTRPIRRRHYSGQCRHRGGLGDREATATLAASTAAGGLDDGAVVLGDFRIDELAA